LGIRRPRAEDATAALCRLIFDFRLIALLMTLIYIPHGDGHPLLVTLAAFVLVGSSVVPLLWWDRIGPIVMRHPAYLTADLVVATATLAMAGADSPFFYFTLGTALLAGILYAWTGAAFFSALLLAGYWGAYWVRAQAGVAPETFQALMGNPALYPIAAAAGAAVRGVLESQRASEAALATERERTRIAREMHDSLAKTIQGIALSAAALNAWIRRDGERAAAEAEAVAAAANAAAAEARSLMQGLRSDDLGTDLSEVVERHCEAWSRRTGIAVATDLDEGLFLSAEARWELFCILREALTNSERYSGAEKVKVTLRRSADALLLAVADDGTGFALPSPEDLTGDGHFGIVGMAERAASVGGTFELSSESGEGTIVRARVPDEVAG
jgi:signal transduction histidine kinase